MSKRDAILKGSSILLLSLAYGCANTVPNTAASAVSGPQLAGSGLIANNAGGLISNNAGGLISNNAGGLISNNAGGLISNNAGGLISNNAGGLISNNAGGLAGSVKGPSAGLISNNAGGLISNNAGGLISNNAGGLISNNAGGLISNNAGGYRTLAADSDLAAVKEGTKIAVFNERNEMISYGWSTVDKDGNYSFKRLKASSHLLFVKAVYQEGDKQYTLMAVAKAPREAKTVTANVDPATTLVAKKVLEMLRLRVVSVSTLKAENTDAMAAKLAPVMTGDAILLAALNPPNHAAKTFDQTISEAKTELPASFTQELAQTVAAAPTVLNDTPEEVGVNPDDTPVAPTPAPTASTGSGENPGTTPSNGDSTAPAPKGAITTIDFGANAVSGVNLDADPNSSTFYLANTGNPLPMKVDVTSTTSVAAFNEEVSGAVKAVTVAPAGRYYLFTDKIVKPDGTVRTFTGAPGASDIAVNGNTAYVTSTTQHCIFTIDLTSGAVEQLAGVAGSAGYVNATGILAKFNSPRGIAYDAQTSALYVADDANRRIRKVTLAGVVSTVAGDGNVTAKDGTGESASFKSPYDVTTDGKGTLYVCDFGANSIRKLTVSDKKVVTIAGNGNNDTVDGTGAAGSFSWPSSVAYGTLNGFPILYVGEPTKVRVVQNW